MISRTPHQQHRHDPDETQRRSALVLRTLPILLIPVVVSLLTFTLLMLTSNGQFAPPAGRPPNPLVPIVVMVVFFSALIILVRLGRPTLSALLIIAVWTLLTTLGTLRSGVTSFTPALLIIPICAAGLLIDWVACVSLAGLALLLVGNLAWLEQRGLLAQVPPPSAFTAANQAYLAFAFWAGVFITVAALTSLLAGGLQRALRQTRAQARALGELSSQLEARVEQQTAHILAQERETATLEERARLAREIHDTLAQGLTGIVVQLGAAKRALAAEPPAAEGHLDLAQQMAREALAEARRSVWNLRTGVLERGDLADALRGLASRPIRAGCTASFTVHGQARSLPAEVEAALLRVAQEALANAAKHAGATRVTLTLSYEPDAVRLQIGDDGVGFDAATLTADTAPGLVGGFGLLGMRERIALLGGTLALRNDGGAQVIVTVPLRERAGPAIAAQERSE
jgi:signal transduction histidine kinase